MTKSFLFSAVAASLLSAPAFAGPQLTQFVTDGNFSITTNQTTGSCQLAYNCTSSGWSSPGGYNFIYLPNTATSTGATGQYNAITLWGAANGGASTWNGNLPTGLTGNFLAADGAFEVVPIQQTITGLTVGTDYSVTFDWAGAQQHGYTSATSEEWLVSLGGQTESTGVVQNGAKGFTGWMTEDMTFEATSTSEVLSFLSVGTPNGQPPFSLLADVSMLAVPEPGSLAMVGAGALGMLAMRRRKRTA
jgi:hypothetical protein